MNEIILQILIPFFDIFRFRFCILVQKIHAYFGNNLYLGFTFSDTKLFWNIKLLWMAIHTLKEVKNYLVFVFSVGLHFQINFLKKKSHKFVEFKPCDEKHFNLYIHCLMKLVHSPPETKLLVCTKESVLYPLKVSIWHMSINHTS